MNSTLVRIICLITLLGFASITHATEYYVYAWELNIQGTTEAQSLISGQLPFQRGGYLLCLYPGLPIERSTLSGENSIEFFFWLGDPTGFMPGSFGYPENGTLHFGTHTAWYMLIGLFPGKIELVDLTDIHIINQNQDEFCIGITPERLDSPSELFRLGSLINTFSVGGETHKISGGQASICLSQGNIDHVYGNLNLEAHSVIAHIPGTYRAEFQGNLVLADYKIDLPGSSAAPVDPSVRISLNKSQYAPGDNMKVTLTTSPGTGDNSWDIYVRLILPDSSLYFVTFEPSFSFSPDLVLARPSKPITAKSMTILDITLPEGLPPGNWQWASFLGKDNLSKISETSWAPFTMSNSQGGELNLTGTWSVQETITGNCPDEDYPYTNTYMAAFGQTGNHLTFTSTSTGTSLSGTISGNSITLTGTRPSEDGTISINFPGTVSSDGNTVTGTATWTWTDGSYTCSGTTAVTMARVVQSTTVNVTGTWQGSWQSSAHNINGTFATNITQQGSVLSGTINVPEIGMSGADLKGTVNGNIITFGDIDEKITFTGTVSGESAASGTYIYPSLTDNGAWQGNKI